MPVNQVEQQIVLTAIDRFSAVFANMEKSISGVQSRFAQLVAIAGGAGVVGGFGLMIKGAIDSADRLQDLSKSTGITVETLGGLGFAASQAGSSLEGVGKAVGKLNLAIAGAKSGVPEMSTIFRNLGISVRDLNNLPTDEIFAKVADAFAGAEDGANKAAYGNKLFGKSYQDIIPTLDEGGAKIRKNVEYYKQYSGVTEDIARRSDEFNDELKKLHLLSGAFATTLTAKLLPALQEFAEWLVKIKEQSSGFVTAADGIVEVLKVLAVVGVNTAFAFSTIGKEFARFAENVKLIVSGDWEGSRRLGKLFADDAAQARKEVDALTERILAFNKLKAKASGGDEEWDHGIPKPKKGTLPNLPRSDPQALAEEKLFISTLQTLEKDYFNLTHAGKLATIMWEEQFGSLRKFTPEHKKELLAAAERIDAYNRLLIIQEQSGRLIESQTHAVEKARDAELDYAAALRAETDELVFQNSLVGKTVQQQEQMTAARRIDLDLRQRIAALGDDDTGKLAAATERMRDEADKQKAIFTKMIRDRQELERSWGTGENTAISKYFDEISNSAAQSERLFTNTFRSMEDALVEFTTTGKLDFKSFANSIIRDLARIEIQRNIMGPLVGTKDAPGLLSQGLSGIAKWLFGGGSMGGGAMSSGDFSSSAVQGLPGYATGTDFVPRDGLAFLHRGEQVLRQGEARGGNTYVIDARGADIGVEQRLIRAMMAIAGPGMVENRAIAAVSDARRRGRI